MSIRSESSMLAKPTMLEPSSLGRPSRIWSGVKVLAEMVVWWNRPGRLVNCMSTNRILSRSSISKTSSLV